MKVLFVASGNLGRVSAITKAQGDSLVRAGVEVEYYLIKGTGLTGYLRHILPLRRQLKSSSYDVVHAHYSLSAYVASLAGARPLVVSLMGSDVKATGLSRMFIHLFRHLFRWKHIIVKSGDMARNMGIDNARVIPNGVNMDLFVPMDRAGCRKKLGWDEGVGHVLFPTDPERDVKDYPLAKAAMALVKRKTQMHFFLDVAHKDTVTYYNAADMILVTSKWEGSPNVVKEALSCGRPVVSTDVGDVRERMDGVEGCYVAESRAPEELAEKISLALDFSGLTAGREKLQSDGLSDSQIARQIIDIYNAASQNG